MSMLIGMLMKFSKYLFFGGFIFLYLMSFYKIMTISENLFYSSMPNKFIVFSGLIIYFIHLVVLFLVFKVHFEKSYFSSLIWASFTHVVVFFLLGGVAFLFSKAEFLLFDYDISFITDMNYNTKFEKINKEVLISVDDAEKIKKAFIIYMYMLILILVIDSLALYKLFKNNINWFS